MPAPVIGRDAELAALESFLEHVEEGPSALVLEGEAGVGKTTLWAEAVSAAERRGLTPLQARPAESETGLSFSGVRDLLDPVLGEALGALPELQRQALARALLLDGGDGPAPDPHAIGVAVLSALRALAGARPLVVAVDDVQWLDPASAAALVFAARRLRHEPVALVLARRVRLESPLHALLQRPPPGLRVHVVPLGPLGLVDLHAVIRHHVEVVLPRPLLAEVHEASGGNPFFALEIVRTLRQRQVPVQAGRRLPVPDSLHELVHGRLRALPEESREFLLAAAALSTPLVSLVEAGSGVERERGLPPALEAGVLELDGDRVRFTHPLLAAGAYEIADPLRRAAVHARLAGLVDDPEARGRHLAAATSEPDEKVAQALDEAARHARARGAPRAAALLLDRARELTPQWNVDAAHRRAVEAAYLHFESGDSRRAESQLRELAERLPAGRARASALVRLARVRSFEAQSEAAELYLQALDEAEGDAALLAVGHEGVAACLVRLRERLAEGVEHAERAAALALELGDEALAAEALSSQFLAETALGRENASATVERALALQQAAETRRVLGQPLAMAAVHWWWIDELERAKSVLLAMLERTHALGDESSRPYVLVILGQVEVLLGLLDSAAERAREAKEGAEQSGQWTMAVYGISLGALVDAMRGRADESREAAAGVLERVAETGGRPAELIARWAVGHLELGRGVPEAAVAWLEEATAFARREQFGEPGAMRFVVDHLEGLIELGRREEAAALLGWYEGHARRLERASALASCARCRGLLAAQAGALDDALAAFGEALVWHARVEIPLDRGRTLLALGAALRRAKRRREARERLSEALAVFERIGAALWAGRARAELRRISGRAPSAGALTPAEQRVAALVAEGRANREVAAALFLSERTVEGHLSKVFAKLGVRHRAELPRVLAAGQKQGSAAPNTGESPVSAPRTRS